MPSRSPALVPTLVEPYRLAAEMTWSVPLVIGARLVRIARGGPRGKHETRRMVTEKTSAFAAATVAAAVATVTAPTAVLAHGLAPIHRTVRANRRRLLRR
ncbi:hypothetical protein [Pseudonocardia xishanensis]|uniref:Uncharacterized protein n=1 Tax=Pseudonocardia xishanensis TaxID=630995 RepID=A0ABP8RTJ9_9PSEU